MAITRYQRRLLNLRDRVRQVRQLEREFRAANPYIYFEPSDGKVDEERYAFLRKWLREEDVPQVLDGQIEAFKSEADIIALFGGNQSGKTTAACVMSYIWATGVVPLSLTDIIPPSMVPTEFPQHIRVVGVDWKTCLANILPTWRYWAPRDYLVNGSFSDSYNAEERTLRLWQGKNLVGTIEFMTNKQDVESFQGPARHGVIYDEEPRFDIYKENLMRFTTAKKLKILFSMTPTQGLSWVFDDILLKSDTPAGGKIFTHKIASITNKKANLQVLEEILSGLDNYEEIKMRLLGEFVSLSGLVYGNLFNRRVHVIKPFDINYDKFIIYRGLDPHLVKPTCCIEVAVDREENEYVIGTYLEQSDTEKIKNDLAKRAKDRGYRLGWTVCDKSADSTITVFGDRNIYRELKYGPNAIPGLFTSEKYEGSIKAGVDKIKQLLKVNESTGKPRLFIFDTAENQVLINAMRTLERDRGQNEDSKGMRDRIAEGKHDTHAALRYIHQRPVRFIDSIQEIPEYMPDNLAVNY